MLKEVSRERTAIDLVYILTNLHDLRKNGGINTNDYIPIRNKIIKQLNEILG